MINQSLFHVSSKEGPGVAKQPTFFKLFLYILMFGIMGGNTGGGGGVDLIKSIEAHGNTHGNTYIE